MQDFSTTRQLNHYRSSNSISKGNKYFGQFTSAAQQKVDKVKTGH